MPGSRTERSAPGEPLVLKRDGLGRVERREGPGGPIVVRVASGGAVPGSAFLARRLLARERSALRALAGVPGVARLVAHGEASRDALARSWIEGRELCAAEALPRDFFAHLEELVRAIHERGVCHNDIHKENNVLVGDDGYPWLVDFQLASVHRRRGRAFAVRCREDLRHVHKHRLRYEARGRPASPGGRRSALAWLWMRLGKPVYNTVTRRVLGVRGDEPRRAKGGPWPVWTASVGPRAPAADE